MNQIITAGLGKVNWRDALHGLYIAIGTAVSVPLLQWLSALQQGKILSLDFKSIGIAALGAGIAYIVKRLFTPAQVIMPATDAQIAKSN